MKLLSICFFAALLAGFFAGCENESGGYSPGQLAAQRAPYDPTPRASTTSY